MEQRKYKTKKELMAESLKQEDFEKMKSPLSQTELNELDKAVFVGVVKWRQLPQSLQDDYTTYVSSENLARFEQSEKEGKIPYCG